MRPGAGSSGARTLLHARLAGRCWDLPCQPPGGSQPRCGRCGRCSGRSHRGRLACRAPLEPPAPFTREGQPVTPRPSPAPPPPHINVDAQAVPAARLPAVVAAAARAPRSGGHVSDPGAPRVAGALGPQRQRRLVAARGVWGRGGRHLHAAAAGRQRRRRRRRAAVGAAVRGRAAAAAAAWVRCRGPGGEHLLQLALQLLPRVRLSRRGASWRAARGGGYCTLDFVHGSARHPRRARATVHAPSAAGQLGVLLKFSEEPPDLSNQARRSEASSSGWFPPRPVPAPWCRMGSAFF
jgi:hypothetical protein